MSIFVDTNILLYAHDLDAGDRHEQARRMVIDWWETDRWPFISVQVLQELYVNLVRKQVSGGVARQVIDDYSAWPVMTNDVQLLSAAINASQRWTVSLWDALIIEAARKADANQLLSEDLNHGQDFDGVRVHNPFHRRRINPV